ncbi:MAG: hypothetical protein R2939_10545 [Kofleriaceae bacterium]
MIIVGELVEGTRGLVGAQLVGRDPPVERWPLAGGQGDAAIRQERLLAEDEHRVVVAAEPQAGLEQDRLAHGLEVAEQHRDLLRRERIVAQVDQDVARAGRRIDARRRSTAGRR